MNGILHTEEKEKPLTKKELEVLNYISRGYSSKEVAKLMEISKRTVEGHLAHIFAKLAVSNRIQAVNSAKENGYLLAA